MNVFIPSTTCQCNSYSHISPALLSLELSKVLTLNGGQLTWRTWKTKVQAKWNYRLSGPLPFLNLDSNIAHPLWPYPDHFIPLQMYTCLTATWYITKFYEVPGEVRDAGLTPGSWRSLGGGKGNPLQCSCLENPTDRGAWQATVFGVAKSRLWLKQLGTDALDLLSSLFQIFSQVQYFRNWVEWTEEEGSDLI